MKTLVLMRHSKAEVASGLSDELRPLAPRGREQSSSFGAELAQAAGPFDVALVSAALRTTETYKLLSGSSPSYPAPRTSAELYGASPRTLLDMLRKLDESAQRVIVVGHEPVMSALAHLLHDEWDSTATQLSIGIPTATAVIIDVPGKWAELDRQSGHVRTMLRPEG